MIAIIPERVIGMPRNTDRHRPESPSKREKVRKNLNLAKKPQAVREVSITAPYLFKEHSEGKKGEKILVLAHFSGSHPGELAHSEEERTED